MDAKVKSVRDTVVAKRGGQTIARLTPLGEAISLLAELAKPVAPRTRATADAAGHVLAADVIAAGKFPKRPVALTDGFAVRAEDIADASSYTPVPLAKMPLRVEALDELPAETDSVAPGELITSQGEAVGAVTPGEGVLRAGGDADAGQPLRRAGERVRTTDVAVFAAVGVREVSLRVPRVRILCAREDLRLQPALQIVMRDLAALGGEALVQNGADIEQTFGRDDHDAVVVIGGTGTGARDLTVGALARVGKAAFHGVGLSPGETAAFGTVGNGAVLAIPGRLDAALAAWLVLGRALLAHLCGLIEEEPTTALKLSRKVVSTVGMAEFVPLRRVGDSAEPLASKHLPLSALTRADGWMLVPPQSEGYPAGTLVAVKAWPR